MPAQDAPLNLARHHEDEISGVLPRAVAAVLSVLG